MSTNGNQGGGDIERLSRTLENGVDRIRAVLPKHMSEVKVVQTVAAL